MQDTVNKLRSQSIIRIFMIEIRRNLGKLRSTVLKLVFLQWSPIPLRAYIGIKEIWELSMQNYVHATRK